MKRLAFLGTVFASVLVIVLPFTGGGGPSPFTAVTSTAVAATAPVASTVSTVNVAALAATRDAVPAVVVSAPAAASATIDTEHMAQKPVPKPVVVAPPTTKAGKSARASGTVERQAAMAAAGQACPGNVGGGTNGAPSASSGQGVAGTTSDDLTGFAAKYNAIRVANCLTPVPMGNFRYDSCMEQRLFWMAEDPSTDPASAWGHLGSARSDGVPSVGCDGNLAGGSGNSGATVAQKWWDSTDHRNSLYRPMITGSTAGVCIYFAMTHGGIGVNPDGSRNDEPYSFSRASARYAGC